MKAYCNIPAVLVTVVMMTQISIETLSAEKKTVDPRKLMPMYRRHCSLCHGSDGKGETPGGEKSGVKDYSDPAVAKKLKEKEKMMTSVLKGLKDKEGKMLMAPFERKLKPFEAEALIKYMEKFSAPKKK